MGTLGGFRRFSVLTRKVTVCSPKRHKATAAAPAKTQDEAVVDTEDIPGPRSLPLLGTLHNYIPYLGEYNFERFTKTAALKQQKYGNVVREEIVPGTVHYHIYEPEHFGQLFKSAGKYPQRPLVESLKKYRTENNKANGLGELNGEAWHDLRQSVQKPMLNFSMVQQHVPVQAAVTGHLVRNIRQLRDPQTVEVSDLMNELYKWASEAFAVVIFGKGIGCMDLNLPRDSMAQRFVNSVGSYFTGLHKTFMYWPLHKNGKTKAWKQFVKDSDYLYMVFEKFSDECFERCKKNEKEAMDSLLVAMMNNSNLDRAKAHTLVADLFFGGVETTAHTMAFNLYSLAKNPDVQQRLFEEIESTIPRGTPFTPTSFKHMPYLKAVIKENFRVHATVSAVLRITSEDTVIGGCKIPKDSTVMAHVSVTSLSDKHFDSPQKFKPERWLHGDSKSGANPLCVLPFGHGPRICIGKRFAEQELFLGLTDIVRNFKIEYLHEDIGVKTRLLNYPDKPLRLKFTDRESA